MNTSTHPHTQQRKFHTYYGCECYRILWNFYTPPVCDGWIRQLAAEFTRRTQGVYKNTESDSTHSHNRYVDFLGGVGRVYGGGFSRRRGRVNVRRVNPGWASLEDGGILNENSKPGVKDGWIWNVIKARKKRGPKPPQRSGGGRPLFARALVYHQSETVGFECFCLISSLFGRFPLLLTTGDIGISGAVVNSGGNNLRVNHLWHVL